MSDDNSNGDGLGGGYGVGVYVFAVGFVVAILSGLMLSQYDSLTLAASSSARRNYVIVALIFYAGGALAVIGGLTAIVEQVIDYSIG